MLVLPIITDPQQLVGRFRRLDALYPQFDGFWQVDMEGEAGEPTIRILQLGGALDTIARIHLARYPVCRNVIQSHFT